jgi:hypothetical protein
MAGHLRGREKVHIARLLIAAGQNLKRLLHKRGWRRRPGPNGAGVVTPGLLYYRHCHRMIYMRTKMRAAKSPLQPVFNKLGGLWHWSHAVCGRLGCASRPPLTSSNAALSPAFPPCRPAGSRPPSLCRRIAPAAGPLFIIQDPVVGNGARQFLPDTPAVEQVALPPGPLAQPRANLAFALLRVTRPVPGSMLLPARGLGVRRRAGRSSAERRTVRERRCRAPPPAQSALGRIGRVLCHGQAPHSCDVAALVWAVAA